MKVIKIKLEYGCFPVWVYNEDNELLENDLPPWLAGDIDSMFVHIQEVYDSLYLNNGKEFRYIGFQEDEKRELFLKELSTAICKLKSKINDEYKIEDMRGLYL